MKIITQADIRLAIPSQNVTQYAHWSKYHAIKKSWLYALRAALGTAPATLGRSPRRVEIIAWRSREMDYANLVGGAKPIPDALTRLGWLVDDSPQWMVCSYEQRLEKGRQKDPLTSVLIYELDG